MPSQLGRLTNLRRVYLKRNARFSDCRPAQLRELRYHDLHTLNLPDCASDAPQTPETPLPTYTLSATAGAGGWVTPSSTTTHVEADEVMLTAGWNDTTHTFAGWSGDCESTDTTCTLELYDDYRSPGVHGAARRPLRRADRRRLRPRRLPRRARRLYPGPGHPQ